MIRIVNIIPDADISNVVTICKLCELHTLKGHVESVVKLDIDNIQEHYSVRTITGC